MSLKAKLEAIIYATEEPVTLNELALLLKDTVLADIRAEEDARLAMNETVSDGPRASETEEEENFAIEAAAAEIAEEPEMTIALEEAAAAEPTATEAPIPAESKGDKKLEEKEGRKYLTEKVPIERHDCKK